MNVKLFVAIPAALLLVSAPAHAQSCQYLQNSRNMLGADMLGIAIDYPMTHAALASCLSGSGTDEDRAGCAVVVIGMACLGMGRDYCNDLTSRWARVFERYNDLTEALRARGCSY